ncbi:MAG: HD domain-containing protein [Chloroflexota bacterium]
MNVSNSILGPRFEEAMVLTAQLHADQIRKTRGTPYVGHLLSTAALVLQDGGSEDEAIAALLHDAVEDQGGLETHKIIREKFGENVAHIVEACSDTHEDPKPPWQERKDHHLEKLKTVNQSVMRVIAADKLHNARSLLRDLRTEGDTLWTSFRGGKEGTVWYYSELIKILEDRKPGYMTEELKRVVANIKALS